MSKISGHAVKLILPGLLSGLDDRQWRSKKGAVDLLGSMAFLAPRQLSLSLPTIIPRLTEVLTDSHTQVRAAANASLKSFGEVVVNPEVKTMSPTLLDALVDPTRKTQRALDALLEVRRVLLHDDDRLLQRVLLLDLLGELARDDHVCEPRVLLRRDRHGRVLSRVSAMKKMSQRLTFNIVIDRARSVMTWSRQ